MENNMNDLLNNVQKMVDNGNIPDNVKELLKNMNNKSEANNDINNILSKISPETINDFKNMINSSNKNSNSENNSIPNIDMNTILKLKSTIEKINNKDDPRANLLYSLKPYLRESKKEKVDQYVNLLNVSKIADIMNSENKKGE